MAARQIIPGPVPPPVRSVNGDAGDVVLDASDVGATVASDAVPAALGVAAAGVATDASRSDHVHALPSAADVGAAATSHQHVAADVTDFAAVAASAAPVASVNDETGAVEVSDAVVVLGSVAVSTAIPLDVSAVYTLTLAADVTLSVSGASSTRSRVVQVLVTASGARALAFEAGWLWAGAKPASMLASAKGLLTLSTMGAAVIASWQDLGDGS